VVGSGTCAELSTAVQLPAVKPSGPSSTIEKDNPGCDGKKEMRLISSAVKVYCPPIR